MPPNRYGKPHGSVHEPPTTRLAADPPICACHHACRHLPPPKCPPPTCPPPLHQPPPRRRVRGKHGHRSRRNRRDLFYATSLRSLIIRRRDLHRRRHVRNVGRLRSPFASHLRDAVPHPPFRRMCVDAMGPATRMPPVAGARQPPRSVGLILSSDHADERDGIRRPSRSD